MQFNGHWLPFQRSAAPMHCVCREGSRPPRFRSVWNLNHPLNAGLAESVTEQSHEHDGLQLAVTLSLCRDTVTMGWVFDP